MSANRLLLSLPLKQLIPLMFVGFSLMITLVFTLHDIKQSNDLIRDEQQQKVMQTMSTLQAILNHRLVRNDLQGASEIVTQYATDLSVKQLILIDEHQRIVLSTHRAMLDRQLDLRAAPALQRLLSQALQSQAGTLLPDDQASRIQAIYPIELGHSAGELRPSRLGALYIDYDFGHVLLSKRSQLYNDLAVTMLAVVLLSALLWYILHIVLTRRVETLLNDTRHLAGGNLAHRSQLTGNDELSEISQAFNHMVCQLESDRHTIASSQKRLSNILDNVIDGIITIDPAGTIQDFNPAAEKIFLHARDNVIGKNIKLLMPEPFQSAHDGYMQNYLNTGHRRIIGFLREVEGLRADGSTFPLELWVTEIWLDQQRLFIGMVRDITERRVVARLKNEFVANVSHELRTPLTSINGSLRLVRSGVMGEVSAQAMGMLDIAEKNSERLILLINDLLDIEKIESGKMDFHFAPVSLAQLLTEAIATNHGYADNLGIRYHLQTPLPDCLIQGDSHRLHQVMSNLLSNACKFSPKGGTVEISLDCSANHQAMICVTDHGSGIPLEFQDRVFQKFAQADGSSSRHHGGTGLGLSITKAIIEHHGGQVGFESTPGEGTRFYVTLPMIRP